MFWPLGPFTHFAHPRLWQLPICSLYPSACLFCFVLFRFHIKWNQTVFVFLCPTYCTEHIPSRSICVVGFTFLNYKNNAPFGVAGISLLITSQIEKGQAVTDRMRLVWIQPHVSAPRQNRKELLGHLTKILIVDRKKLRSRREEWVSSLCNHLLYGPSTQFLRSQPQCVCRSSVLCLLLLALSDCQF